MRLFDVLAIGEILVDLVADEEPSGRRWKFMAIPGGAPAKEILTVGVARLGRRAGFLGAISGDPFGEWLSRVLTEEGVDHRWAPVSDRPTTLAVVGVDADGERQFSFYRNETSDLALLATDIPDEALCSAKAIHVCSVSLSREPAREAVRSAVRRAREAGVFVSFDVNLRPHLWRDLEEARALIREMLAQADLVKLSEEELEFMCPGGDLALLRDDVVRTNPVRTSPVTSEAKLSHRNGRDSLWVLTRGGQGAAYAWGAILGETGGFPVRAVDTTGAGDAFIGAFLARLSGNDFALVDEADLRASLRFAHAAAALCVQRRGAIPALPTLREVLAFLSGSH